MQVTFSTKSNYTSQILKQNKLNLYALWCIFGYVVEALKTQVSPLQFESNQKKSLKIESISGGKNKCNEKSTGQSSCKDSCSIKPSICQQKARD